MGVDISLFLKVYKTRVFLGRDRAFNAWNSKDDSLNSLSQRFRDEDGGLNQKEMLEFLKLLQKHWVDYYGDDEDDSLDWQLYHIKAARKIVKDRPKEIFFGMHDHHTDYSEVAIGYTTVDV